MFKFPNEELSKFGLLNVHNLRYEILNLPKIEPLWFGSLNWLMLSYDFSITFFILQFHQFKVLWCCLLLLRILEGSWGKLRIVNQPWSSFHSNLFQIQVIFYVFQMVFLSVCLLPVLCFISDRFVANVCMCSQAFKKAPDDPKLKYPTVSKCSYGELNFVIK